MLYNFVKLYLYFVSDIRKKSTTNLTKQNSYLQYYNLRYY